MKSDDLSIDYQEKMREYLRNWAHLLALYCLYEKYGPSSNVYQ